MCVRVCAYAYIVTAFLTWTSLQHYISIITRYLNLHSYLYVLGIHNYTSYTSVVTSTVTVTSKSHVYVVHGCIALYTCAIL